MKILVKYENNNFCRFDIMTKIYWSDFTPMFDPITDLDLITEFDLYIIVRGSHRTFATGAACTQRTLLLQTPGPVPLCDLHML